MSERTCPNCEENGKAVEKKISIRVGKESFSTRTLVCKRCGRYEMTSKILKEMDAWGRGLTKNIVEPQPVLNEAAHRLAERLAAEYGMKRVPLLRVLTAFYLTRVVGRDDFHELKTYCESRPPSGPLVLGTRSKVSVPIRYVMFRSLQTFSEVWKVSHAKAIEEAVTFGLTVLSCEEERLATVRAVADNLRQYIADVAQTA